MRLAACNADILWGYSLSSFLGILHLSLKLATSLHLPLHYRGLRGNRKSILGPCIPSRCLATEPHRPSTVSSFFCKHFYLDSALQAVEPGRMEPKHETDS